MAQDNSQLELQKYLSALGIPADEQVQQLQKLQEVVMKSVLVRLSTSRGVTLSGTDDWTPEHRLAYLQQEFGEDELKQVVEEESAKHLKAYLEALSALE